MKEPRQKHSGGRPPKFLENRRPVTVTLPETTLHELEMVNKDRARAIVKVTQAYLGKSGFENKKIDIVEIEPGSGIILVGQNNILNKIPLLRQVEVSPGRFLLTVPPGTPLDSIELALSDLLESKEWEGKEERQMLVDLLETFKRLRRDKKATKAEMIFISI